MLGGGSGVRRRRKFCGWYRITLGFAQNAMGVTTDVPFATVDNGFIGPKSDFAIVIERFPDNMIGFFLEIFEFNGLVSRVRN